ncbi:MAG: sulfatase-like hydrolase/transferase [Armatimonadetes bacterium]|nr:sulfatase-like hydrolase/transferase [Armatimonadota bacterium]
MPRITRRDFMKAAGGFVSAAALSPNMLQSAVAADGKKLNILLLMTDQHCHSVLGCAGNRVVQTPNLDRLAGEGARFTNAVCATPFCSPTRASMITGKWPHAHGIVQNIDGARRRGLDDNVEATEQILFDQGVRTFQMGKWHLGEAADLRCYRREQDMLSTDAYIQSRRALTPDMWDKPRKGEVRIGDVCYTPEMAEYYKTWSDGRQGSGQNLSMIGRSLLPARRNYESWLADRCVDLIEKYGGNQFMITWSANPPHAEWIVPDPYYGMYDPARVPLPSSWSDRPAAYRDCIAAQMGGMMGEARAREMVRCYYGQVSMMDWCIGRILDSLREKGLEDNTLVIFTSDHGDMQGSHGMIGKSLPGYYEEIVRVPLIVRCPGVIKPGTVIDTHANTVDLAPTLLEFAGRKPLEDSQGVSLRPLLEGGAKSDDRPGFCERGLGDTGGWSRMVRTREWKYAYFSDGRRELFNLAKDSGEVKNLREDTGASADMKAMHKKLVAQAEKSKDPALAHLVKV